MGTTAKDFFTSKKKLSIGIDLGSDTVKLAFAYLNGERVVYGKFDNKPLLTQIAIPSVAYWDVVNKKWLFGDQVGQSEQSSFITVVKIKQLISLLSDVRNDGFTSAKNKSVSEQNAKYYHTGNHFPKFFFPARRKMLDDYDAMVKGGNTFNVEGYTPEKVCEQFFVYISQVVTQRIFELERGVGCTFDDYNLALVHPSSVCEKYLDGLKIILKKVFGKTPHKVLNSNKALAVFAEHRKAIANGENFLVFDMAEEDVSVARIVVKNGAIIIDGQDGHNEPYGVGGVDVDDAIANHILSRLDQRETMGTPKAGSDGHIEEKGVYSKQYLFMKDIKKAKVIFSKPIAPNSRFSNGVAVGLSWEVNIQQVLTTADVQKCIGVEGDTGIARKIFDYILSELKRPLNHNVRKIFVSGGLTETFSLLPYLKAKLKVAMPRVEVATFDDGKTTKNVFDIQSFEDSVFAPAVGGAIASLTNKNIEVVLSLSYGTWSYQEGVKVLSLFANRGDKINPNGHYSNFCLRYAGVLDGDEMFSTFITQEEIDKGVWDRFCIKSGGHRYLVVDEHNTVRRKELAKAIDLKTVSGGGKNGYLIPTHNGRHVVLQNGAYLSIKEGMQVSAEGRAHPRVINDTNPSKLFVVVYRDDYSNTPRKVYARDIVLRTGLGDFDTSQG